MFLIETFRGEINFLVFLKRLFWRLEMKIFFYIFIFLLFKGKNDNYENLLLLLFF